jgi:hypothetical protein
VFETHTSSARCIWAASALHGLISGRLHIMSLRRRNPGIGGVPKRSRCVVYG